MDPRGVRRMLLMTDCAFLSASPNGILIASAYVPPPWEIIKGVRLGPALGLVKCVTSAIIWPHEAHKHWVLLALLFRWKGREIHQNNFGVYAQFLSFHFCILDDSHLFYCAVERIKCAIINADCRPATGGDFVLFASFFPPISPFRPHPVT